MNGATGKVERRILTLLHNRKTRTRLSEIHAHFLRHELHQSTKILSHFVSVCWANGKRRHAEVVFNQAKFPDRNLYNAMIKGYSISSGYEESLVLYSEMKSNRILGNEYTFPPLIKCCCSIRDKRVGDFVYCEVKKLGYDLINAVRIGVVEFYSGFGEMNDAQKVFDEMPERDVIVWNLMVRGFFKIGDVDNGLRLFRQMKERSIVSWNSMISNLEKCGRDRNALDLFQEMLSSSCFRPDEATLVTVLPICARLNEVTIGKRLHSCAQSSGLFLESIKVGNSIVSFYCKCGDLETAHQVFIEMPRKSAVSWNTLLSGLAFNGKGELGVDLFDKMINQGVKPNDSTFVGVLTCCSHARLLQKGRELFMLMAENYKLVPKLEHYGCMVDLLGRCGCLNEAFELIKNMPMRPNAALLGSLLSASRSFADVKLAEYAAKELINVEPWNSGNYVLLSNIYAEEGRWDEVDKVRLLMKSRSVRKSIGVSGVALLTNQ